MNIEELRELFLDAPSWVKWIAVDKEGDIYYHEFEPVAGDEVWDNHGKQLLSMSAGCTCTLENWGSLKLKKGE